MRTKSIAILLSLISSTANAAFFLNAAGLKDMMSEYEYYQEKRQIKYMAKAAQYVGYITGVADAADGSQFCLPGGITAEQTAILVTKFINEHPESLSLHAAEVVTSALKSAFPCKR